MAKSPRKINKYENQVAVSDPMDAVFRALANCDRRKILDLLSRGPQTTGAICKELAWLDRCTVMLHLKTLERAGLVFCRRVGRRRWNYLDCSPIQRVYRRWIRSYAEPAASLLARIKVDVEQAGREQA